MPCDTFLREKKKPRGGSRKPGSRRPRSKVLNWNAGSESKTCSKAWGRASLGARRLQGLQWAQKELLPALQNENSRHPERTGTA